MNLIRNLIFPLILISIPDKFGKVGFVFGAIAGPIVPYNNEPMNELENWKFSFKFDL